MKNSGKNDNEASDENTCTDILRRGLGRRLFSKASATAPLLIGGATSCCRRKLRLRRGAAWTQHDHPTLSRPKRNGRQVHFDLTVGNSIAG